MTGPFSRSVQRLLRRDLWILLVSGWDTVKQKGVVGIWPAGAVVGAENLVLSQKGSCAPCCFPKGLVVVYLHAMPDTVFFRGRCCHQLLLWD